MVDLKKSSLLKFTSNCIRTETQLNFVIYAFWRLTKINRVILVIFFKTFNKNPKKNNLMLFKDFFEFITTMGILSKGGIEDKLKLAFDIYDYNDDGFIEKKEAEKIVQVRDSFMIR